MCKILFAQQVKKKKVYFGLLTTYRYFILSGTYKYRYTINKVLTQM